MYLQLTVAAIASTSSEDKLQIDVCWLMASPTRRTSDSSSILERKVSFACSRAKVRKAMRRSVSVDMGFTSVSYRFVLATAAVPRPYQRNRRVSDATSGVLQARFPIFPLTVPPSRRHRQCGGRPRGAVKNVRQPASGDVQWRSRVLGAIAIARLSMPRLPCDPSRPQQENTYR